MVQRIFPDAKALQEGTVDFARKLAINSSPTAMAVIKQQAYTLPGMDLMKAQDINDKIQMATLRQENPDHQEGFAAFGQKREPNFKPFDPTLPFYTLAQELLKDAAPKAKL